MRLNLTHLQSRAYTLCTLHNLTFSFFRYSMGVIPSTLRKVLKKFDFLKPHLSLSAVNVNRLYSPASISRLNSSKRYLLMNS